MRGTNRPLRLTIRALSHPWRSTLEGMRIAIIGTGIVGRTLAVALQGLGHDVVVGTRSPDETGRREEWVGLEVPLMPLETVAATADLVVNATSGQVSLAALGEVGSDHLAGKVVMDVSNPLDFSQGFPPTLSIKDTDSLAEQLQRTFPEARVVKALNTVTASVMVNPASIGDGDTTVFAAGDEPEARQRVVGLLRELGWKDIVELDGLHNARGLEMWMALWVRLMRTLGTAEFNLKLVR
ncbi:MAG: NAD(P)-binding domain-containing protein [Marmoricola sp.]